MEIATIVSFVDQPPPTSPRKTKSECVSPSQFLPFHSSPSPSPMARKLLNASAIDLPKPEFCAPLCDSTKIPYGICPSICNLCPPACIPLTSLFQIPPPPPQPPSVVVIHKTHSLSPALTISVSLLATAFFLFTCYTVYKFCPNFYHPIRRPSRRPEEEGGPDDFLDEEHGPVVDHPIWYIRTIGLQPSVIIAITIVKYKRGEGLIEGTDCSVCLSEFEEDETLRLLPKCNHAFHLPCIDTWLRAHTNCPMCRAGIVNDLVAALPSRELAVHNPGPAEENQPEIAGVDREVGRDSENVSESRPGIEDDGVSCPQSGLKSNEDGGGLDGIVPMRRSVSMDSLSASTIRAAIANAFPGQSVTNSENQLAEVRESMIAEDVGQKAGSNRSLLTLVASPLVEKYLGTAGAGASCSSIKRSVSCSAKVWLSRHSRRSRSFRA